MQTKVFDPINTLLKGTNLIEASAGTGKTYTIAGIFLRLILEARLTADQILVVTFTKAATEELKERIRNKLLMAKSAFLKGGSNDDFIDALVKKYDNSGLAVQLIQDAVVDFDNAAIFTIHGFCQRVLHENAFETQSLFDTELMTDPIAMSREVADDFWRKHFYSLPAQFLSYFLKKISGPEYFFKLLTQKRAADIRIIPELEAPDLIKSIGVFEKVFNELKVCWLNPRDPLTTLLKDPSLSGTIYGSLKPKTHPAGVSKRDLTVASMIASMDRFVDEKSIGFPLFKGFDKFTSTKIEHSTRKNHTPPSHDFFDVCDALYIKSVSLEAEMETYLVYLKTLFFKFAQAQLLLRKKRRNVQFYDDLLEKVKNALEDNGGNKLATTIRGKYRAALVDEFQDTDSIQYEIFTRLFASEESTLFMIGDPKQAIYGFRGADIFSYMKAARSVDSKYTLIENWRSTPGLITALNTLFSNSHAPFVYDQIGFEKGIPGGEVGTIDPTFTAPLVLWYLEPKKQSSKTKSLSKTEAVPLIARAIAGEILHLISKEKNGGCDHVSDRIKAGDIAVLVRTNRQAQIIKNCLSSKKIPSVLQNTGNIFHASEALELERILLSIAEPSNEGLFKTALVTDIIGVPGRELDSAGENPFFLAHRSDGFREYFRLWNQYGFIRMFRMFMVREMVRERLLGLPDGERRLTNLLHLTEILHQTSVDKKLGITGLIKWLSEQRHAFTPESETHQLRLESDDQAVKIITIHKSKGLEYPVVFCPFAWDGSIIKAREIQFHNNENNETLTFDLGSKEIRTHLTQAQNELLAENLRLLYVALTRGIKKCYLIVGRFNTAETSAIAYLLHYQAQSADVFKKEDLVTSLKTTVSGKNDADMLEDLIALSNQSDGAIDIIPLPLDNGTELLTGADKKENISFRRFSGKIDTSWKISSYSHLISQRASDQELPDRDPFHSFQKPLTDRNLDLNINTDIFSFPKGTRPGIFFHEIFEHLDFSAGNSEDNVRLVTDKLQAYGFESKWQKSICTMIDKVLSITLEIGKTTFRLSSVQGKDRINEMEFYFPLKPVSPQGLKKIFENYGGINLHDGFPERLEKLDFSLTRGFLKGYIDMVFHHKGRFWLVDWKSNFLGTCVEDYGKDALTEIMNHDFYILQYHLYALSLYQYLQLRLPDFSYEKHFGGVFYIFIRGVDPDRGPEFGIYKDLPNTDLINALLKALIPGH
jgi:exodeoxyribonuclease V beta subunit